MTTIIQIGIVSKGTDNFTPFKRRELVTHTGKLIFVLDISTLDHIIVTDERNSFDDVESYIKDKIGSKDYNKHINAIDIFKLDHIFGANGSISSD